MIGVLFYFRILNAHSVVSQHFTLMHSNYYYVVCTLLFNTNSYLPPGDLRRTPTPFGAKEKVRHGVVVMNDNSYTGLPQLGIFV